MMLRRILLALVCCTLGATLLDHYDVSTVAVRAADGIGSDKTRTAQKRKSRTAKKRGGRTALVATLLSEPPIPSSPLHAPSVKLLDAAGIKQLLAPVAPPNDRPLLINFWATWCEPCREEFPDLVRIYNDYNSRGLYFASISIDDPSELKTGVPKFLSEMHSQIPAFLLNVTDSEPVINSVDPDWGGELPATFLFDKHGQVVFKHKGRINPTELRAALDKVLSE